LSLTSAVGMATQPSSEFNALDAIIFPAEQALLSLFSDPNWFLPPNRVPPADATSPEPMLAKKKRPRSTARETARSLLEADSYDASALSPGRPSDSAPPAAPAASQTEAKVPFVCDECGESFSRSSSLCMHKRKHEGPKPFPCAQCAMGFVTQAALDTHTALHLSHPHHCPMCGSSFKRKEHLVAHARTHTGDRPYSCSMCTKTFTQAASLRAHAATHAQDAPGIKCTECGSELGSDAALKQHMKLHEAGSRFACEQCPLTFARRDLLARHMITHSSSAMMSCSLCPRTFARRDTLAKHMLREHGEHRDGPAVLKCPHCPASFRRQDQLQLHLAVHDHGSACVCSDCGLSFSTAESLRVHRLIHGPDEGGM
jgi:uncharacterized Zn-finger protein